MRRFRPPATDIPVCRSPATSRPGLNFPSRLRKITKVPSGLLSWWRSEHALHIDFVDFCCAGGQDSCLGTDSHGVAPCQVVSTSSLRLFLLAADPQARARSQQRQRWPHPLTFGRAPFRPYHDPSFSRTSGSGRVGSISLRRHFCSHVCPRSPPAWIRRDLPCGFPADRMIHLWVVHALSSAPSGRRPCVT